MPMPSSRRRSRPRGVMRALVQGGFQTSWMHTASAPASRSSRSAMSKRMNAMQGQAVAVKVRSASTVPPSSRTS